MCDDGETLCDFCANKEECGNHMVMCPDFVPKADENSDALDK